MSDVNFTSDDFSWSNEAAQLELNRDEYMAYREQDDLRILRPQGVAQPNRPDNVPPRVGRVGSPRMGRTIGDFLKGPPRRA